MQEQIAELNEVVKTYGGKRALDGLTFRLGKGKIVGLLGPNGSGKTTVLKLLNGLLQPDSGSVRIAGSAPGVATKKMVSYLPERTYFNQWMRVNELLRFFSDFYETFDEGKARRMLSDLHIQEDSRLKTLSKGMREKVQLVLVMSRNVPLYLLDEPIGGVDPAAREYILHTILENYQPEASILISTHLIQDVEKIFDDVIFLSQGRKVLEGNVDDLRQEKGMSIDELFREVFRCSENY